MIEILINHFFNYEFVYIFLLCSLILLLLSIFIKKDIIKKISMLLFSIFFILFLFELVLSFFMPIEKFLDINSTYLNDIEDKKTHKEKEIEYFDSKGMKKKCIVNIQNFKIEDYNEYKFIFNKDYTRYNNRFRVTECDYNSKETYLFLGCSFMFGDGVGDDETLPYFFSKLYGFNKNVINCGTPGKSTNTMLNILNTKCFLPLKNESSKIMYCFCNLMGDHFSRNFRYYSGTSDVYKYKNNKFIINKEPNFLLKYCFKRSYIFRKIFLPIIEKNNEKYYMNYLIKSLEEINKIVEEKYNSKLTIIVWPDYYNGSFLLKLKATKLDLIFLPEYFNSEEAGYKIKYDGHPTAKANKEIAEILYNHINKSK